MAVQETISDIDKKKPNKISKQTKVLLEWRAPARPFKKRDREYFTTIGAIVFLLAVILLFLKEWLLIAVMVALAFVSYVLASVPPGEVKYVLTNKGIRIAGKFYPWENLHRFWFAKKWDQRKVVIELKTGFPGRLFLMLGDKEKEEIKKVLIKYLEQEKPELSLVDNAAKWLSKKVPLES